VTESSASLGACASTTLARTAAAASSVENASLGAALAIDANPLTPLVERFLGSAVAARRS